VPAGERLGISRDLRPVAAAGSVSEGSARQRIVPVRCETRDENRPRLGLAAGNFGVQPDEVHEFTRTTC
jgi:hypothetical protein